MAALQHGTWLRVRGMSCPAMAEALRQASLQDFRVQLAKVTHLNPKPASRCSAQHNGCTACQGFSIQLAGNLHPRR